MKNKVREYSILRVILILLVVMTHSQYLKITTSFTIGIVVKKVKTFLIQKNIFTKELANS